MGIFMGTEDVPVIYDTENDKIEDLPDSIHDDTDEQEDVGDINVIDENSYGITKYLGNRDDKLNIEAYFREDKRKDI